MINKYLTRIIYRTENSWSADDALLLLLLMCMNYYDGLLARCTQNGPEICEVKILFVDVFIWAATGKRKNHIFYVSKSV